MIIESTRIVTPDNGPRPAGKPDQCFYCRAAVGEAHEASCVLRKRTVIVEVKITLLKQCPEDWDKAMIEFHMNDSSSCCDNLIHDIKTQMDRLNANSSCSCNFVSGRMLREATAEDHADFHYEAT